MYYFLCILMCQGIKMHNLFIIFNLFNNERNFKSNYKNNFREANKYDYILNSWLQQWNVLLFRAWSWTTCCTNSSSLCWSSLRNESSSLIASSWWWASLARLIAWRSLSRAASASLLVSWKSFSNRVLSTLALSSCSRTLAISSLRLELSSSAACSLMA